MEVVHPVQHSYEAPQTPLRDENAPPIVDVGATPATTEKWNRTVHPRGRQARDPLARTVPYQVTNLETMKDYLRDYLANPTGPAEHTTVEFLFPTSAAFTVYTGDLVGAKAAQKTKADMFNTMKRTAITVVEALNQTEPKEQMRKQKAIAKSIIEAISEVDGFRYSFHNNWLSKEDEACRFSYYCNDSTLNKGRAANEGAGMEGKKKVKPVYDCSGLIWVKFSITKNNLEIQYKHVPIHKTYEERAPPPRRDSKRRKMLELFNPEKLPKPGQKRSSRAKDSPDKPRKRRATEPLPAGSEGADEGRDESLAPIMDFLGSVDKDGNPVPGQIADATDPQLQSQIDHDPSGLVQQSNERATRTPRSIKEPKAPRSKKASLPGMMSGYMAGDLITWGEKERRGSRNATAQQIALSADPLATMAAAAADATPSETQGLSELDLLKAKLAAAEAKIHNLESEKTRPIAGPPGWPPPRPPPPAPQQYNYPPPPPTYGHYPTSQFAQSSTAPGSSSYGQTQSASGQSPSGGGTMILPVAPTKSTRNTPRKTRG